MAIKHLTTAEFASLTQAAMSIPTVVFLKNGVEFDRKVGVMPGDVFTGILDDNL